MKFQAKSWSATGAASIISFFLQQLKLQCAAWHERSVDYNQHLILNSDRTHWTHDNASKRSTSPGIMFLHFLLAAVKEAGYFFVVHTCFAFAIFCKSKSNNNTVYISNNCQVYFKWRMCRTWCSCMAEQVWNMKPLWCWLQCWWRWCSCHKKMKLSLRELCSTGSLPRTINAACQVRKHRRKTKMKALCTARFETTIMLQNVFFDAEIHDTFSASARMWEIQCRRSHSQPSP